ncbi:MAG TPA: AsnC family transcriptional regulator [Pseudonocardia sp.]|nr:AsnC family transcriptional regulator [Pseudonocardia sp.]
MGTHQLDDIERGLPRALQVEGRVAFQLVGELLGVSDQTVARRYARLRAAHGVRVTGALWPEAVGQQTWLVRVRCAPEAAAGLARALTRQDDTSWVRVASGGAEIVCMARMAADASAEDHAVLSRLLDITIVNVAVPSIQKDFGGSLDDVLWIATAYTLMLGVVVPLSSWLGERLGLTVVYILSLAETHRGE